MIINTIEDMDNIIASNPSLSWSGWDVVYKKQDDYATYLYTGVFENGQWHNRVVFPLTSTGWDIPEGYL